MFIINEDKSIYITRGDVAFFSIKTKTDTGETYKFQAGDVVRFKVFGKKDCENVVLQKDFGIEAETEEVGIYLEEKDTKIGDVISKPIDYWYEVELNPYTDPQTIIGYDEDGAKVFKLFPEGNEKEDEEPITPEDIPVVDEALDLTSTRPVQNQAIARAISKIRADVLDDMERHNEEMEQHSEEMAETLEECKNVLFEDITDDFFETEPSGGFWGKIYKQGNIIHGAVMFQGVADVDMTLFKIKKAYNLRSGSGEFAIATGYIVALDGDDAIYESIVALIGSASTPYCDVVVGSKQSGVINLSFTYVCN